MLLFSAGGYFIAARQSSVNQHARVEYKPRADDAIQILSETDGFRTVRHALGDVQVPAKPKRIVSLVTFATDSLLALGITPVAVETEFKRGSPPAYLAQRLFGVATVGFGTQIDIEAVLAAKPDLILCGLPGHARIYNSLSRIAPTVFLDPERAEERHGKILEVAEIVGMAEAGKERVRTHFLRLADARGAIQSATTGQTVAALRVRVMDVLLFSQSERIGPFLFGPKGLGLSPAPQVPTKPKGRWADPLDYESLGSLNADHIFVILDRNGAETLAALNRLPTWRSIPAVKKGNVHVFEFATWFLGEGILSEEQKLMDVQHALKVITLQ